MSKNILRSKTFWLNVLAIAGTYSGLLPAKPAAIVTAVANIGMRLITKQPVKIWPER